MPERTTVERPNVLVVDDDAQVLAAVERDMKRRYASRYRVVSARSGEEALGLVDRLALRDEQLALVMADQRMPSMTGTELLAEVSERSSSTRRVLLTAYADTDAAIEAINRSRVDYYILKPWDPPEERLFPVLDDLLEDWEAVGRRPREIGLRVVGDRWSTECHVVREFLARNHVPFRWLEAGRPEADRLIEAAGQPGLPLVVLEDGKILVTPTPAEVAEAIGMQAAPDSEFYDLVVVGAGPAGLAAAVYGASEGLSTAVVEATAPGGQAGTSSNIENYLGFPGGISGSDLARRALTQARKFGATFITPRQVTALFQDDPYRTLRLDDGSELRCAAVIVATGVQYRTLDVPGAEDLVGRGVYYGTTANQVHPVGAGETVVVVGGANSAGQAAVYLADCGADVHLVVRAVSLAERMSSYLIDQVEERDNITVRVSTQVAEVGGEGKLERMRLEGPDGPVDLTPSAAFVFIGAQPRTSWLEGTLARDAAGYLMTGPDLVAHGRWSGERDPMLLETSIPGVFAVGDVRSASVKRVASAVGEGSVAVHLVHAYLAG